MKKERFSSNLAEIIKEALLSAPNSQISPELRREVQDFFLEERDLYSVYDYFSSISDKPDNEASSFVRTLCNVKKYYLPPR